MKKNIIFLSLSVCLFVSCDKFTDIEYYGSNNTDKTIVVKLFTNGNADSVTYELNPGDVEKQMSIRDGAAPGTKHFSCCPCYYDNIKVEVKDKSKNVIKNPMNRDSWSFKIKKGVFTKSSKKIHCFLSLEPSDLQ